MFPENYAQPGHLHVITFCSSKYCLKYIWQFGGLNGNSISHYMIELINFILYNQYYELPIAVLICWPF